MGNIQNSGILSGLMLSWLNPAVEISNRRPLEQTDLPNLDGADFKCENLTKRLENSWAREKAVAKLRRTQPDLWKALFQTFSKRDYAIIMILMLVTTVTMCLLPFLLYCVLLELSGSAPLRHEALITAVCLCLCAWVKAVSFSRLEFRAASHAIQVVSALSGIVYKKMLRQSSSKISDVMSGHVINLFATDVQSFRYGITAIPGLVMAPIIIATTATVMVWLAGWPALVGLAMSVGYIAIQSVVVKLCEYYREKTVKVTDQRVTLVSQIISGIRVIKMNAWETPYYAALNRIRRSEMYLLAKKYRVIALFDTFYCSSLPSFCVMLCYMFTNRQLDHVVIFTVLSYFTELKLTVSWHLAYGTKVLTDSIVSMERIRAFLLDDAKEIAQPSTNPRQENDKSVNILHDISMEVSDDSLVAVIGPVGSGKSTLLETISGMDPTFRGKVETRGSIAYVPQMPWIFLGTVRENILFNASYDADKYERVIEACDLKSDFKTFPNGDLSVIGERGIALSGGQRARVSLARAVYLDADVYLLDDPLSAVDFKVGKHIFERCICGVLKSKLRVLVTHNEHCLENVDEVILMEKGTIVSKSSYQEFIDASRINKEGALSCNSLKRPANEDGKDEDDAAKGGGISAATEEKDIGAVSCKNYWEYLRAGLAAPFIIIMGIVLLLVPVLSASPNWILAKWDKLSWDNPDNHGIIIAYISLSLSTNLFRYVLFAAIYFAVLRCSSKLHNKMGHSLLHAPVHFFDRNPTGRIVNRFSADLGEADNKLPTALGFSLNAFDMFVFLFVPVLASYWLLLAMVIPLFLMLWYSVKFLRVSRDATRLQSLARSPVFSHISNTVEGLPAIHMHDASHVFIQRLCSHQNNLTQASFSAMSMWLWLNMRVLNSGIVFLVIISIAVITLSSSAGFVGLAITYALTILLDAPYVIESFGHVQAIMTSIQRVMEYCRIAPEPAYRIQVKPTRDWPRHGALLFNHVSLRYYKDGPQVLKDVTFSIEPQQKIGIAGRTGAGKSSIVASLMRMPEATPGIQIDGVDICGLNLQSTRQAVSVIQQNPVMFCGSIRNNLDPFDIYTDDEIWSALHDAKVGPLVSGLVGKLKYHIQEGGANFSVGERQLFSLARALLHKKKIIVMDEATANVDPQTDHLIQTTIRDKFKDCTVLIIAHRLSTIMDCDRIMVLHDGQVVEMGTPEALMGNADSWLAQLWQHSH
ncbi:predicted protein [Nematostella vectensis]|uniref:Uncharacterized protein n=1 Tax=Nematostella vectensis TaxID=45351 RepID=A7RK28_NEMVE|nr:predicted protein [Nematostella vectensis]|eukprot:XP_001640239.1 predicted protein [Nematostella vectensis]